MATIEAPYRSIVEESADGIVVIQDGEIRYANEQFTSMLGYDEGALIGTSIAALGADPDSVEQYVESPERTATTDSPARTLGLETNGGEQMPVSVSTSEITHDGEQATVWFCRDNTAQAARNQELAQFREAIENTAHPVYITDTDGTIEYVNSAFEKITGYTRDEAIGETPRILQSGEHDDEFWETISSGERWESEMVDERTDRDRIVLEQTVAPLLGDDGEPQKFVAVAQDVTQHKQYEQALERAQDDLRQIIDLVPDLIFAKDRDGRYLLANEATAKAYGKAPEEVEGKHESDVLPAAEESTEYREDDIDVIESGETKTISEERLMTAAGETRIYETTKLPYEVSGTGEDAVLGYARDITELKQYEKELASERDFLESVIESVPYPFYVINLTDYSVEYANAEASINEGNTCYEVTHEREDPCDVGAASIPCPIEQVQEREEPVTVEHVHTDDEGNERTYQVQASPIFDDDGNLVQIAESNIDITDRTEYQKRLEEQRDNLEVLNQVVRHDIRNDLQLVQTYAETLQDYVDEAGEPYIDNVLEAAHDAVDITKTARDVTDVMLQSDVEQRPIPLRFVLENEIDDVRSSQRHALVTVDGSIPNVEVIADDMLESVFRNLLSNAIQHNDSEVPEVTVSAARDGDTVEVRIADNGPGIPDERKETVFEQGEMSLESQGTGLGLYLVDTLVDRYGGTVRVEDNDPTGAVFVVKLVVATESTAVRER